MPLTDTTIALPNGNPPVNIDSLPPDVQQALQQSADSLNKVILAEEKVRAMVDAVRSTWEVLFFITMFALAMLAAKGFFTRLKESDRQKFVLFFAASTCLIMLGIYADLRLFTGALFIGIFIGFVKLIGLAGYAPEDIAQAEQGASQTEGETPAFLRYNGNQLGFSIPKIHDILNNRWPYFSTLNPFDRDKFGARLKQFMEAKTFDIYDTGGYVEMPVLISAAAIQITFGLEEYLLPDFPLINIYPDGFFMANPYPRFLEGNVSNGAINLSWKHFLVGIQCYTDGDNVGLHEMSHALYSQSFLAKTHRDPSFCKTYAEFNDYGTSVFSGGKTTDDNLYSDYAFKNIQEFWAVSVEIFFEESNALKTQFPSVYNALVDILNQDPVNKIVSVK